MRIASIELGRPLGSPLQEFGFRLELADRLRLALTEVGLAHRLSWLDVERAMSAIEFCYGDSRLRSSI